MVDAAPTGSLREVAQPKDLIAEEEEAVLGPLTEYFQSELIHEKPAQLGPVAYPNVHVVEADQFYSRCGSH